jgi:hypothetical protein
VETTGTTEKRAPTLTVMGKDGEKRYPLPIPSQLMVADGDSVNPGDALAKKPVEKKRRKAIPLRTTSWP